VDFGRLDDASLVPWELPPRDPSNRARVRGPGRMWWGAPSWGSPSLAREAYPPRTPRARWLAAYAQRFPAVELNATFYGVPAASTLDAWLDSTPSDFVFCPKLPRAASHAADLGLSGAANAAIDSLSRLGTKLGHVLVQLPEALGPDRLALLERFVQAFATRTPLALELRHPGWFQTRRVVAPLYDLCRTHGVSLVTTDVPGRRDVAHGSVPGPAWYVRVGAYGDARDPHRVLAWAERLRAACANGLGQAYLFVHDPDEGEVARRLAPLREPATEGIRDAAQAPASHAQLALGLHASSAEPSRAEGHVPVARARELG
jgi:uncharacterized protein YecE (DUF72 family)